MKPAPFEYRAAVLADRGSRPPGDGWARTPKCWPADRASSRSWRCGWPDRPFWSTSIAFDELAPSRSDRGDVPGAGAARPPAGGGAFGRGPAHTRRCCARRSATSAIRRSATGARSAAAWPTPTPPPSCPTVAVRSTPSHGRFSGPAGSERSLPPTSSPDSSPRPSSQTSCSRPCASRPSARRRLELSGVQPSPRRLRPRRRRARSSCSEATATISQARIALSGVGSVPVRAGGRRGRRRGTAPSAELWEAAGAEAAREIDPTSDLHGSAEYRRRLAAPWSQTALETAAGAASGGNRE